jgi:hypothetical protein
MDAPHLDPAEKRDLLFDVQRSIRYHDRRIAYFDRLHKITNAFTILIAGVVILDAFVTSSPDGGSPTSWQAVKIIAAIAALLGVADLVMGFAHSVNQHRDLKRKFCILERQVIASKTQHTLEEAQIQRSEIEAEEPPIYRALDAMCYNETVIARDDSLVNVRKVPRLKRLTANWLRWSNVSFS